MTDKTSLAAGTFAGARARIRTTPAEACGPPAGCSSSPPPAPRWAWAISGIPYVTGQNGGGAFVLVYLACILLIGIPLLMAEVMIGRRGRANPDGAVARLARDAGASSRWRVVGWLEG